MTNMTSRVQSLRLFLDTGVIIGGCTTRWGASKLLLILMTDRLHYTVVFAEAVEQELRNNVAYITAPLVPVTARERIARDLARWLRQVRLERWPTPTQEQIVAFAPILMPALRHRNDLPAVATAIQARPDWVISSNRAHWNEQLAERIGLRIVTPQDFMSRMRPPE